MALDDQPLGGAIELYHPKVIPTDPIPLDTRVLTAGAHMLTVEIVGKKESAVPSYMFGLDEVLLEPQ